LIEIGSKTADKNSAQTNKQTDRQTDKQTNRHYENNGHLAVNQYYFFCCAYPQFAHLFHCACNILTLPELKAVLIMRLVILT